MRRTFLSLVLLLVIGMLAGCQESKLAEEVFPVCKGTRIEGTAQYSGEGIHPLLIIDATGESHEWNREIPDQWKPMTLEEVQLVACTSWVGKDRIEVCEYFGGPDINRYRHKLTIRIVEAHTANVIAENTFFGNDPRDCYFQESGDFTELVGDDIFLGQAYYSPDQLADHVTDSIQGWLEGYVESRANILTTIDSFRPGTFEVIAVSRSSENPVTCEASQGELYQSPEGETFSWSLVLRSDFKTDDWIDCTRILENQEQFLDWSNASGISFWTMTNPGVGIIFWVDLLPQGADIEDRVTTHSGNSYAVMFGGESELYGWRQLSFAWNEFSPAPWVAEPVEPFDPTRIFAYGFEYYSDARTENMIPLNLWVDEIALFKE